MHKKKFIIFIILFFSIIGVLISLNKNQSIETSSMPSIELNYNGTEKIAYLTFDDGPTKACTPKILDILKSNNINATFFVTGKNVEANPSIVKRAADDGNFIANHTYCHTNNIIYQSKESFINEIKKTDNAISNAIGKDDYCSRLFRFPNGFSGKKYHFEKLACLDYLESLNYHFIDWNCTLEDSVIKCSNSKLLHNLKKTSKNKGTLVVLMHDSGYVNKTNEVLQDVINYLKKQGYEFHTLDELLN